MGMSPRLLRPRESGAFTPKSLSGLQLWLDAADSSTVTLNGGNVSEWRDKSPSGINYSQATAAYQPGYSTAYKNGKNAVRMGASATTYLVTGADPALSFRPATVFFVFQEQTRGDFDRVFNAVDSTNNDISSASGITLSLHEGGFPFRVASASFVAYPPAGDDSVAAGHNIVSVSLKSSSVIVRRNGTAGTTVNTNTISGTPKRSYLGVYVDGDSPFIGAYYLKGAIYEIVAYNRDLAADEISKVEAALSKKWDIALS
jgi:hypothetical protein